VEVVHIGYGHITASDDIVAAAHTNGLVDMDVGPMGDCGERTQS
jgi:hypothetical protein